LLTMLYEFNSNRWENSNEGSRRGRVQDRKKKVSKCWDFPQ